MAESDQFWDFYWEVRLQELQDLGKRAAILEASKLIRQVEAAHPTRPLRLLELGCGTGQILGALAQAHAQVLALPHCTGVDYVPQVVESCQRTYPELRFLAGDFTDPDLIASLGQFDLVLLVNALHEVFSATISKELDEVDVPRAKKRVHAALSGAASCVLPGGYLLLFDGLEPPGDPQSPLVIRFHSPQARQHFHTFAHEYRPFRIQYEPGPQPGSVRLSQRDFTRYITKSIFLGKRLWQTERLESYQYFTQTEFLTAFASVGLEILELRTLTVDEEKWDSQVEILTQGVEFPTEHILILAQKPGKRT
jgi:SAM-dependent methyltransferase